MPRFEQLTPRQRECLRALDELGSSQEVANRLSLSLHTVNKHLQAAMHALDTRSSLRAAQLFVSHERAGGGESSPDHKSPVAASEPNQVQRASISERVSSLPDPAVVREQGETYDVGHPVSGPQAGDGWRPWRRDGQRDNGLSLPWRLAWVLIGALVLTVIALLAVSVGLSLTQLHRS